MALIAAVCITHHLPDSRLLLDVMLQQLGVGHWRLGICMSPAAFL